MDQFVEMYSKLEELQRKASLDPGNIWEHPTYGEGLSIWYWPCLTIDKDVIRAMYFDGYGIKPLDELGQMTWKPILEQLVGMMPKGYLKIHSADGNHWTVHIDKGNNGWNYFTRKDLKIAMLQALAWARWGKEWDEEKEEWK